MQPAAPRVRGVDSTIDAGDRGFRPIPKDQPQPGASLWEIFEFFAAKPSPRIIATTFAVATVSRFVIGGWRWWDLAIPAAIIALEPITEWVIHVHVLHRRPTQLGRFTIDPITSRKHREHHRNPKDLRIVMVPFQAFVGGLAVCACGGSVRSTWFGGGVWGWRRSPCRHPSADLDADGGDFGADVE